MKEKVLPTFDEQNRPNFQFMSLWRDYRVHLSFGNLVGRRGVPVVAR